MGLNDYDDAVECPTLDNNSSKYSNIKKNTCKRNQQVPEKKEDNEMNKFTEGIDRFIVLSLG